jgi:hypothetical protein
MTYFRSLFGEYLSRMSSYKAENFTIRPHFSPSISLEFHAICMVLSRDRFIVTGSILFIDIDYLALSEPHIYPGK